MGGSGDTRGCSAACERATAAAAKAQAINAHGRAAEIKNASNIKSKHAAGRAIPLRRGQARSQRCARILRHAQDLKAALSLSSSRIGVRVCVDESVARACAPYCDSAATCADRVCCHNVFIET